MKRMASMMALALMASACAEEPHSRDWNAESEAMFAWIEEKALTSTLAPASPGPNAEIVSIYLLPLEAFEGLDAAGIANTEIEYPRAAMNILAGEDIEQLDGTFTTADIDKYYVGVLRQPAICGLPDENVQDIPAEADTWPPREGDCFHAQVWLMGHLKDDKPSRYYAVPQLEFGPSAARNESPGALSLAPPAIDICGFAAGRGKGNGSLEDDAIGICNGRLQAATAAAQGMTIKLNPVTTEALASYVKAMVQAGGSYPPEDTPFSFVWDFSNAPAKGAAQ